MTEWIDINKDMPPFDIEVLCKHKDYNNYWISKRWVYLAYGDRKEVEYFKPTICTCCEMEPHNFEATHWRFIDD